MREDAGVCGVLDCDEGEESPEVLDTSVEGEGRRGEPGTVGVCETEEGEVRACCSEAGDRGVGVNETFGDIR